MPSQPNEPVPLRNGVGASERRQAIARVVWHGREQLVLLRPVENLIGMELLHYDAEVTKPAAFEDDVTQADPPALDVSELHILTEEELDEVAGAMGGGLGMGGMNPF